jgi:hypothetical protein
MSDSNTARKESVVVTLEPKLKCSRCGRELEEGEFMAVVGSVPPSGLSMPIGRGDVIVKKIGDIYCERCFAETYRGEQEIKPPKAPGGDDSAIL